MPHVSTPIAARTTCIVSMRNDFTTGNLFSLDTSRISRHDPFGLRHKTRRCENKDQSAGTISMTLFWSSVTIISAIATAFSVVALCDGMSERGQNVTICLCTAVSPSGKNASQ